MTSRPAYTCGRQAGKLGPELLLPCRLLAALSGSKAAPMELHRGIRNLRHRAREDEDVARGANDPDSPWCLVRPANAPGLPAASP